MGDERVVEADAQIGEEFKSEPLSRHTTLPLATLTRTVSSQRLAGATPALVS